MQEHNDPTPNREFKPTSQQRDVLEVFRKEYQVNPMRIRELTGLTKQRVNDALSSLVDAGWVENVTRGLYRLIYDGDRFVEQNIDGHNLKSE